MKYTYLNEAFPRSPPKAQTNTSTYVLSSTEASTQPLKPISILVCASILPEVDIHIYRYLMQGPDPWAYAHTTLTRATLLTIYVRLHSTSTNTPGLTGQLFIRDVLHLRSVAPAQNLGKTLTLSSGHCSSPGTTYSLDDKRRTRIPWSRSTCINGYCLVVSVIPVEVLPPALRPVVPSHGPPPTLFALQ